MKRFIKKHQIRILGITWVTCFLLASILGVVAVNAQVQDTVSISLKSIDAEIKAIVERQSNLAKQIESAQKDIIYMQGMIDVLQSKRQQLTPVPDTTKTKTKEK